jgi:molybdate transport system substrate-binding protein
MRVFHALRQFALCVFVVCTAAQGRAQTPAEPVTVFAAASLRNALEDAAKPFISTSGIAVRFSFAASSALARQIESGAPADLFASADVEWMDYLQRRNLIKSETRADLLGNRLVFVAAADSPLRDLAFTSDAIRQAAAGGRIVTGEVTSVPVGRYAKAALENLGLWSEVQPLLAQVENVRAALAFVSRGEAPLGILYETDAKADAKVKVVAVFPPGSYPPIVYPFAVTANSKANDNSQRLLTFLQTPQARSAFEAQGFTLLPPARGN